MKNKKVLIVGQGLAGSILAFQLHQAGFQVKIYNAPQPYFTSSLAAGGLFNPVTGRKLEQTWLADELFQTLFSFYPYLEQQLSAQFFFPMPLFRPFANDDMRNWLLERKDQIHHAYLDWTEQGVYIHQTGWVDVAQMLKAFESFFVQNQLLIQEVFTYDALEETENGLRYKGVSADYLICCEGFHAQKNNPYFKDLCFLPAKGELLKIYSPGTNEQVILNKNGFLLPIGNQGFKVGATYSWDDLSEQVSPNALEILEAKIAQFEVKNYEVEAISVGVRPATQDRRPFVGFIPGRRIGIFNGFGSKGVSLIPYFSKQLTENMLNGREILAEASIHRFSHLFSI